jgi:hypothetical protein
MFQVAIISLQDRLARAARHIELQTEQTYVPILTPLGWYGKGVCCLDFTIAGREEMNLPDRLSETGR